LHFGIGLQQLPRVLGADNAQIIFGGILYSSL
jgi:hypothetical protein